MIAEDIRRRYPIGAEVVGKGTVAFRVWAPKSQTVKVGLSQMPDWGCPQFHELTAEGNGYFSEIVSEVGDRLFYKFQLSSGVFPDPASRFQPRGPHGASQIIDHSAFGWTDEHWKGVSREGLVIYEMHVGTFTPEGTYAAAARQLPELARVGIKVIELMPVAEFSGRFGWGYDGVDLFAPTRLYGEPDDLRTFINRAHSVGLGVILDVVYNHLGPDGCYLKEFSSDYITNRYGNEWGEAINFDGNECGPVREFFVTNARYWIEEFHFDGFRFDATQQIFDASPEHILEVIAREARAAAGERSIFLAAENEPQCVVIVEPPGKGYGMDALWNDDFHHTAMVASTGHSEAYYQDYKGSPQEFISAMKWGYLYQGQWYDWQKKRRGTPTFNLQPSRFVTFLQNHDQVANSLKGERIDRQTGPGVYRALTALLLLGPSTPMLFQGQEFAASTPFLYFADHHDSLARMVENGRREFLHQFPRIAAPETQGIPAAPESERTFGRCKLDFSERTTHAAAYKLHCDLLKLRAQDKVFAAAGRGKIDGAVLSDAAFVLRYFGDEHGDRLLVVNLGRDLHLSPAPEPLLAPPYERLWRVKWSSEDPQYGGYGTPGLDTRDNWRIPAHAAVVLEPERNDQELADQQNCGAVRRTA